MAQLSYSIAQSYQRELTIEAWKWFYFLLKPNWHLDTELVAF